MADVGNDLIERVRLGYGLAHAFSNFTESRCGLLTQAWIGRAKRNRLQGSNGLLGPGECFGSDLVQVDLRQARMVWVFLDPQRPGVFCSAALPECGLCLPNEQETTGCMLSIRPGAAVFFALFDGGSVASSLVVAECFVPESQRLERAFLKPHLRKLRGCIVGIVGLQVEPPEEKTRLEPLDSPRASPGLSQSSRNATESTCRPSSFAVIASSKVGGAAGATGTTKVYTTLLVGRGGSRGTNQH